VNYGPAKKGKAVEYDEDGIEIKAVVGMLFVALEIHHLR
jgi:hypothetical protein